jgi:HK97 family phage major capsid protein/HK97 family phage prohead protease
MRYAVKSAPPPGGEPNEFVMSDSTVDRVGDVVEAKGWQLANFKNHPIALFNHDRDQVIGRWADVQIKGDQLVGRLELADEGTSPLVDTIRRLHAQKILRAVSVGFRPLEKSLLTKDADKYYGPFRFTKSELLECSLVSVPANPNALAVARGLPHDAVAEVFCKPATEHPRDPAVLHGKPAAQHLETKGFRSMSIAATTAAKIQTAQQNLNALLTSYEELAGKPELSEDETKSYRDDLPAQIEAARVELESHKRAERILVASESRTTPPAARDGEILAPNPAKTEPPPEPVRLPAQPKRKLEFSDHQFRALAAWTKAQAAHDPDLGRTLRDMYQGHNASEITNMVLRAAVNPANTTVATWAAELIATETMPFLDRLIPDSIFLPLAGMGVRYTFGNAGILKIPVRASTPTLAGNWVAEAAPKPVRRASFTTVSLAPTKLSVISTFTEEMATYSPQSIEQIIRQAMSDDTSIALDTYLIDAVAASAGVRPAGLLNGVTPITASVLTPATAAMVADLKALVAAIIAAGGGRAIAVLINPAQALSLGFAQTTTGDFLFNDRAEAGSKFGVRFIVSATVPAGRVIAVDAADFASAQGDSPRFAVSTDATLHEEDTTPLALGTTGSPNVVAAPMRSLFQTDAVAVRMSLYVSWVMRRAGMVQTIAAVTW